MNQDTKIIENKKVEVNEETSYIDIFVYGTLRSGRGNNILLQNEHSQLLGITKTPPEYDLLGKNAGFPICTRNGSTAITGEVWRVTNNEVLKRIHNLEGSGGRILDPQDWYQLTPLETEFGPAYFYTMEKGNSGRNENSIVESGDWLKQ